MKTTILEGIRRLLSPDVAERGAEEDAIARAPEGMRERLAAELRARRRRRTVESYPRGNRRMYDSLFGVTTE